MEEIEVGTLSDRDLLLIITHEEEFDKELFLPAKEEWDQRALPKAVIEQLSKEQNQVLQKFKNEILFVGNLENKVAHLMALGIDEKIALKYGEGNDPSSVMTSVIYLGLIILALNLIYKFIMNFIG